MSGAFLLYCRQKNVNLGRMIATFVISSMLIAIVNMVFPIVQLVTFKQYNVLQHGDLSAVEEAGSGGGDDVLGGDMLGTDLEKSRFSQIQRSLEALKKTNIWAGAGFGVSEGMTAGWQFAATSANEENWGTTAEKMNQFLANAEELGIIGLFLSIFLVFSLFRVAFSPRRIWAHDPGPLSKIHSGLSAGVFAGLVAINAESFFFSAGSQYAHLLWLEIGLLLWIHRFLSASAPDTLSEPAADDQIDDLNESETSAEDTQTGLVHEAGEPEPA
jgi:hypothetical protein